MQTLRIDKETRLLVLTGAGVSAESGIPTFRGGNGLWENHPVEQVASPDGFWKDPSLVWRFYSQRRAGAAPCKPNPGHLAMAEWERKLGNRFLLATQNIDGLHRAAGNQNVVELHGNLFTTRCSRCERDPFKDTLVYPEGTVPLCGHCGGKLRPHIVWFGENLDERDLLQVEDFLGRKDTRLVFMAVGTSGAVWPAAGFVGEARERGGETWLVNADPADNTHQFHYFVQGRSGEVLPDLVTID